MEEWCRELDWSKAKTIFIVTFLLLNILLGYQIYLKQGDYINNLEWSTSNMDELSDLLQQQRISLNIDIPKEQPQMHFLQVKSILDSDTQQLSRETDATLDRTIIEGEISELVYNFEDYVYSLVETKEPDQFMYYQTLDDFPFFGAKLKVEVLDQGIINYNQSYYEVISEGLDREVISSNSSLRTILDQQLIPSGAIIEDITLGYQGQSNQSSFLVLTPVWRITYQLTDKQEELYINALSGGLQNIANF